MTHRSQKSKGVPFHAGRRHGLPRLLILDLDPPTRALLQRQLAATGFSVFQADTIEDARRLVRGAGIEVLVTSTEQLSQGG